MTWATRLRRWLGGSTEPPGRAGGAGAAGRVTGEPGGGASSWHLWWVLSPDHRPLASVAATLTVLEPPVESRLYFWALQATFAAGGGRRYGAAHLGLQWNPRFPGNRAVNWGGYAETSDVGSILSGTESPLPSTPDDANTRNYPWQPGVPYRLRISRGDIGWRGEITELTSGQRVAVRELLSGGDRLESPVVWAEVFCRCDHPATAVAWTDFEAVTIDGAGADIRAVRTSFPSGGDCDNTTVDVVDGALVQRTNATRTVRAGDLLPAPTLG